MSAGLDARVLTGYAITALYVAGSLMTLVGIVPTFRTAAISLGLLLSHDAAAREGSHPLSERTPPPPCGAGAVEPT